MNIILQLYDPLWFPTARSSTFHASKGKIATRKPAAVTEAPRGFPLDHRTNEEGSNSSSITGISHVKIYLKK